MRLIELLLMIVLTAQFLACGEISNELCTIEKKYKTQYAQFNGIDVYNNIDDAIKCSTKMEKPIFIIFSGFGNRGARKETFVDKLFKNRRIRKLVADNFIPVVLYVDDGTKLQEIKISVRNEKEYKLRTIGNLNSDYQIRKLKNNSQPQLVILEPNGEEIISQMGYSENTSNYFSFLNNGYNESRALQKGF